MTTLKKCPFCGCEVSATKWVKLRNKPEIFHTRIYFFKCQNEKCGAIVSFDNMVADENPEEALEYWNRRTKSILKMAVVRCKECKHRNKSRGCSSHSDDYFCAFGEIKDGEHDV